MRAEAISIGRWVDWYGASVIAETRVNDAVQTAQRWTLHEPDERCEDVRDGRR